MSRKLSVDRRVFLLKQWWQFDRINRHNRVCWTDGNPHDVISQELNVPVVTIWAGIWSAGVIVPHFYDGTMNA